MFTYRSARRRPPLPRPGRPQAVIAAAVTLTAVLPASVAWAAGPARSAGAVTGTLGDLTSVAVIPGTTDAWAVGWKCPKEPEGCTPGPDLVLRKGTAGWSAVPAPSPGGQAMLVAVSADSASDAWAVESDDGGEKNLYLHWNGSAWKQVPGPTPDGSVLTGVTAISPSDALAVGSYTSPSGVTVTLALRWNGKSWAKQTTPDPSSEDNELLGVTATSASSAWAAGFSLDAQSRYETLILHWNGSTWQRASAPAVATFGTRLSGIAAGSPSDVWAVGQFFGRRRGSAADPALERHHLVPRHAARCGVQDRDALRCHFGLAVRRLGGRPGPVRRAERPVPVQDPDHALERHFLDGCQQRQHRRQRRPEQPDRCRRGLGLGRVGGG